MNEQGTKGGGVKVEEEYVKLAGERMEKRYAPGASDMALAKRLAARPEDLSSIPGMHLIEGERRLPQAVLHAHAMAYVSLLPNGRK